MKTIGNMSFMTRLVVLFALIMLNAAMAFGQYSVSSFKGDVKIKHAGQAVAATQGMPIGAFDLIVIGQGAEVVIFDKASSSEYTRNIPGEVSPNTLVIDAKKAASSNLSNIHRNIGMTKSSSPEEGKMYVEKGKITLALEDYDPTSDDFMVDAKVLAAYAANKLNTVSPDKLGENFPVGLRCEHTDSGLISFELDNTSDVPLYVNVIKILPENDGKGKYRISELGQPVGCYVLLPNQAIMRRQSKGAKADQTHILVAAHYYFSIDDLIESIATELGDKEKKDGPTLELPIYLKAF
ncbi:MAG: hypothetical protein J1F05_01720 [Muribaculaceae bacterium]|nr:hypothetical protein [Muribaculaceae bacterium]